MFERLFGVHFLLPFTSLLLLNSAMVAALHKARSKLVLGQAPPRP